MQKNCVVKVWNEWEFPVKSEPVAVLFGVTQRWVEKWASRNNVPSVGEGKRKTFYWRLSDVNAFAERKTKMGRPTKEDGNG